MPPLPPVDFTPLGFAVAVLLCAGFAAWVLRYHLVYWRSSRVEREILEYGKPLAEMTEKDWADHDADQRW